MHYPALHIGEAEIAAGVAVGEAFVVKTEGVKDGGVEVVPVHGVFHGTVAEFIRSAISETAPHTATNHLESGFEKGGEIAGQQVGSDEPHPDGEDLLQCRAGEAGAQRAAHEHSSEAAANEKRGDWHGKLLPVREMRGHAGE
jgi:hypothetical protein